MPTDLELDGSPDNLGSSDPSSGSSDNKDATIADLRKRLAGQTKAVDRLMKENLLLKSGSADGDAKLEQELSEFRVKFGDLQKAFNTQAENLKNLTEAKSLVEQTNAKLKAEKDVAKTVADKYPNLLQDFLIGDLKLRTDFDSDEDYAAYLDRQAKKSPPAQTPEEEEQPNEGKQDRSLKERMRGATPSSSTRVTERGGKARNPMEISDELMALSPADPRYGELLVELNEATS